jgi:acetyl esterase
MIHRTSGPNEMEYDIKDVEFLRHADKPLFARLYRPRGPGPFRMVVELHGGVWSLNDRTHTEPAHRALAEAGIAVAALDFRQAADGAYPRSVADAHYGIRWIKANAHLLNSRPDLLGVSGQSSGGHIALLIAMRPKDPRYSAIKLPDGSTDVDATFHCLNLFWPVVNPASRYRTAKQLVSAGSPPDWAARHIPLHDAYWGSEASMTEGSPLVALQRREAVSVVPTLLIQPRVDQQHIYQDPASSEPETDFDKFVAAYRAAGASLDVALYDAPQYFTVNAPSSAASIDAFARMVAFFQKHIPQP